MNKEYIFKRQVRFGDCDPGGVMYTPRISYFIVEAILDFMSDCFGAPAEKSTPDLGVLPPTRSLNVDFLKPISWDDELEIHVSFKEIRKSAIAFSVHGLIAEEKVFTAELTQVCISPKSKQPTDIPEKMRHALVHYGKRL